MAIGPWQILIVVAVLVVLFGANRLSSVGKGLGEGLRNFRKALSEVSSDE